MKKSVFPLYFLVISFTFLSCEEDYLDRPPKDQVDAEFFFNTAKDLEVATNDFYTMLPNKNVYTKDASSDNILPQPPKDKVTGGRLVPTSRGSGGWSWSRLRDINFFLENYKKVDDEEAKEEYSGVARFFRAYFYFEKVKRFGDVPWYNKVLEANDEDLYNGRDSRKLVMDSVIADIDYAIENIPEEKELNKITKYTALFLKARLSLFEGTFRKYHDLGEHEEFLEMAAEASNELIQSGAYSLYKAAGSESYGELFGLENQDETETILAKEFNRDKSENHNIGYLFTSGTQGVYGIPKDMINSYLMKDGTPFTDQSGYETMGFYEEMQNRDPRLTQTTAGPNFTVPEESSPEPVDLGISTTGYRVIKALPPRNKWSSADSDVIVYRYAEALLIYAEAKAELGTLTQDDLDLSINKIRDRVEMPHLEINHANANPDSYLEDMYPNIDQGSNKGVLLEIRRERRIEMFNEALRWDDLMRWKEGKKLERPMLGIYFSGLGAFDFNDDGEADVYIHDGDASGAPSEVSSKINIQELPLTEGGSGNFMPFEGGNFDEDKDYYYPIPKEDLNLNDNLEQNPNWDF